MPGASSTTKHVGTTGHYANLVQRRTHASSHQAAPVLSQHSARTSAIPTATGNMSSTTRDATFVQDSTSRSPFSRLTINKSATGIGLATQAVASEIGKPAGLLPRTDLPDREASSTAMESKREAQRLSSCEDVLHVVARRLSTLEAEFVEFKLRMAEQATISFEEAGRNSSGAGPGRENDGTAERFVSLFETNQELRSLLKDFFRGHSKGQQQDASLQTGGAMTLTDFSSPREVLPSRKRPSCDVAMKADPVEYLRPAPENNATTQEPATVRSSGLHEMLVSTASTLEEEQMANADPETDVLPNAMEEDADPMQLSSDKVSSSEDSSSSDEEATMEHDDKAEAAEQAANVSALNAQHSTDSQESASESHRSASTGEITGGEGHTSTLSSSAASSCATASSSSPSSESPPDTISSSSASSPPKKHVQHRKGYRHSTPAPRRRKHRPTPASRGMSHRAKRARHSARARSARRHAKDLNNIDSSNSERSREDSSDESSVSPPPRNRRRNRNRRHRR